jgi:hypothetical protein
VFLIGIALNFVWEMVQAPPYAPMGPFWRATWRCFRASLGDGVLVLLVWVTGGMLFNSSAWFVRSSKARLAFGSSLGLGLAVLIECGVSKRSVGPTAQACQSCRAQQLV